MTGSISSAFAPVRLGSSQLTEDSPQLTEDSPQLTEDSPQFAGNSRGVGREMAGRWTGDGRGLAGG